MSGLWDLPIRFENRVLNSLLGGWSLNGIASLWSGYPFTVTSGVDNARTGTGNQRADLIGDPYLSGGPYARSEDRRMAEQSGISHWRRHSRYVRQSRPEHVPRPGLCVCRLRSVQALRHYGERVGALLRFEAFNVLNRVNLQGPNSTTQNNANFMRTTAAEDPRILQFALRLTF